MTRKEAQAAIFRSIVTGLFAETVLFVVAVLVCWLVRGTPQ